MSEGGLYLACMDLPVAATLAVGALGMLEFAAGDYVYVGTARRGRAARVARHRRTEGKRPHWHIDALRAACRWLEARELDGDECELAERIAGLPGASREQRGFGASDCRCPGHLVRFERLPELPGVLERGEGRLAEVVDRPNRFILNARLPEGDVARAHLPNTARLTGLVEPGRAVLLRPAQDPKRRTRWSATRIWDGTWVSLEAAGAARLVEAWLDRGGRLPGLGPVRSWRREVSTGGHRIDLCVELAGGRDAWIEVKSTSRARGGAGLLSRTPSTRGAAHLDLLGDLVARGAVAGCVIVVQRADAERLDLGGDADPGWTSAVLRAQARGVEIMALGCRITPTGGWIEGALPIASR